MQENGCRLPRSGLAGILYCFLARNWLSSSKILHDSARSCKKALLESCILLSCKKLAVVFQDSARSCKVLQAFLQENGCHLPRFYKVLLESCTARKWLSSSKILHDLARILYCILARKWLSSSKIRSCWNLVLLSCSCHLPRFCKILQDLARILHCKKMAVVFQDSARSCKNLARILYCFLGRKWPRFYKILLESCTLSCKKMAVVFQDSARSCKVLLESCTLSCKKMTVVFQDSTRSCKVLLESCTLSCKKMAVVFQDSARSCTVLLESCTLSCKKMTKILQDHARSC